MKIQNIFRRATFDNDMRNTAPPMNNFRKLRVTFGNIMQNIASQVGNF